MSIDLEDYFCDLPFDVWPKYQSRVEESTDVLLDLFERYNVKATFFTLGYIAEKFPRLIKKINEHGHELGSHSYTHLDLRKTTQDDFEKDLIRSITVLEKVSGQKILGFRAPYFSVEPRNSWVFNVLKKYLKYDSSVFPVKTPLYGIPKAPRFTYHPSSTDIARDDDNEEFIEIPPLTYRFFSTNLPIAGGFHFRFFPYWIIKKGIKVFEKNHKTVMLYMHPKDLDRNMPKIPEYGWHYYYGKRNVVKKFEKLLKEFRFITAREALAL